MVPLHEGLVAVVAVVAVTAHVTASVVPVAGLGLGFLADVDQRHPEHSISGACSAAQATRAVLVTVPSALPQLHIPSLGCPLAICRELTHLGAKLNATKSKPPACDYLPIMMALGSWLQLLKPAMNYALRFQR